jgi:LPXTG-motif cell wall-anchored protein
VSDDNPYNAVVKAKVSVGDFVWVDTDKDGRQDAGEPGIPGVTLVLTGPDGQSVTDVYGNPVKPVVTDKDGKYSFDDLPVLKDGAHYTVSIDKTASAVALKPYVPTLANQGDRVLDSSNWTASSQGLTKDADRDATLDFGFVVAPPTPGVVIVKKDAAGNDANTTASSVDLTGAQGATNLVFTIRNTGSEALTSVAVSDKITAGSAKVTGLTCDFSKLGGPATGTTWAGPFKVGTSFTCTARLTGVMAGEQHTDSASVTAVGAVSKKPVSSHDEYNAKVVKPTPAPKEPGLAFTGAETGGLALGGILLMAGSVLLVGARRRRRDDSTGSRLGE